MERAVKKYFPIFALPTLLAFVIGFIAPFIEGVYRSVNSPPSRMPGLWG